MNPGYSTALAAVAAADLAPFAMAGEFCNPDTGRPADGHDTVICSGIDQLRLIANRARALALRNRRLMQTATDGLYIVDRNGNLVEANHAFCRMLGYTHEQMATLNIRDWDGEWSARRLQKSLSSLLAAERLIETSYRRRDGSLLNVEINMAAVSIDDCEYICASVRDISERIRAELDLRIAAIAFEAQESMFVTDAQTRILQVNRAFTSVTGYGADEAVGMTPRLLKSGCHDTAFYRAMWKSIKRNASWQGEIWDRRRNGEVFPAWLTITAVLSRDGEVLNYVCTLADMTDRKKADEEIQRLAFYDSLTHLPNRRLLLERLQHALLARARSGREGALFFIDLDNFKNLNDTLGHDAGDLLLQLAARRLLTCIRKNDTVARFGGDEFVVMLEGLSENHEQAVLQAKQVGNNILAALDEPYQLDGRLYHGTSSIGVALFAGPENRVDELLKRADLAMYQAKASGRNTMCFFDSKLRAAATARALLEADLREGIRKSQFDLHLQIQVDSRGKAIGAEALLRWMHPTRGLVFPEEFVPLAEEIGLIIPLGRWALEAACRQLVAWAAQERTAHLSIAVNVSARQFRHHEFVEQVLEIVQRTGADPCKLKLELTESLLVDDVDDTIAKMKVLKAKGLRFSLDDFGTGYSSLSYLKRLPLDQLKIDRQFVSEVLSSPKDAAIVRTIAVLALTLGMNLIAEGVESSEQQTFLESNGCHVYQGYLFGRPVPAAEFEAALARRQKPHDPGRQQKDAAGGPGAFPDLPVAQLSS